MGLKRLWNSKANAKENSEQKAEVQANDVDESAIKSTDAYGAAWSSVDSVTIVLEHLYSLGLSKGWFMNDLDDMDYDQIGLFDASVAVASSIGDQTIMKCYPPIEGPFSSAVQDMGFAACLRIDSNIVHAIMDALTNNATIRKLSSNCPIFHFWLTCD